MDTVSDKLALVYNVPRYDIDTCLRQVSKKLGIDENEVLFQIMAFNMNKCLRDHNLVPIKMIGKGFANEGLFQVCYNEDCDYFLKFVSKDEAEEVKYSEKFGKIGISPKILIKNVDCKNLYSDSIGFVMEKMDGDLSELLFDPYFLNKKNQTISVLNQVVKIITTVVNKYNIDHRDTKVSNFVYKKTSKGIKVYLIDWGLAKKISPDDREKTITADIDLFKYTFFNPEEGGSMNTQEAKEYRDMYERVLHPTMSEKRYRASYRPFPPMIMRCRFVKLLKQVLDKHGFKDIVFNELAPMTAGPDMGKAECDFKEFGWPKL